MKNRVSGFTLIELLVVITLIAIMGIGVSKINFNAISAKEENNGLKEYLRTSIETVKNNALIGKGIGDNLEIPNYWKINIKKGKIEDGNGGIKIFYGTGDKIENATWNSYSGATQFRTDLHHEIKEIKCYDNKKNNSSGPINEVDIQIEGKNIYSSGCTLPNDKIVEIWSGYKSFSGSFSINRVTGVIEY